MKRMLSLVLALGLVGGSAILPNAFGTSGPALAADEGPDWVVAAPGRVEPKNGMVNIGTYTAMAMRAAAALESISCCNEASTCSLVLCTALPVSTAPMLVAATRGAGGARGAIGTEFGSPIRHAHGAIRAATVCLCSA